MCFAELLVPALMIGFGSYFARHAPKRINPLFGYRTTMSMKNRDTWEFAHHHNGKIWRAVGWALLALSVLVMAAVRGRNAGMTDAAGTALILFQAAVLVASIVPTEIALRRTFDRDGRRK